MEPVEFYSQRKNAAWKYITLDHCISGMHVTQHFLQTDKYLLSIHDETHDNTSSIYKLHCTKNDVGKVICTYVTIQAT